MQLPTNRKVRRGRLRSASGKGQAPFKDLDMIRQRKTGKTDQSPELGNTFNINEQAFNIYIPSDFIKHSPHPKVYNNTGICR